MGVKKISIQNNSKITSNHLSTPRIPMKQQGAGRVRVATPVPHKWAGGTVWPSE